jgi:hypothetical protein
VASIWGTAFCGSVAFSILFRSGGDTVFGVLFGLGCLVYLMLGALTFTSRYGTTRRPWLRPMRALSSALTMSALVIGLTAVFAVFFFALVFVPPYLLVRAAAVDVAAE